MALLTRRHALGLGIGALSAAGLRVAPAVADDGAEMHGMSVFGDLKYPADFQIFDYVNPKAPKGGAFSVIPWVRAYNQSYYTFNSLNAYVLKGEGAQGMDMTFATLMSRANDEPDATSGTSGALGGMAAATDSSPSDANATSASATSPAIHRFIACPRSVV